MLDLDCVSRCQRRNSGQRAPPRWQPVAPEHCINQYSYYDSHDVLQRDDHKHAMRGLEQYQQEGVPDGPDAVRRSLQGCLDVGEAVWEPERGRVSQHRYRPHEGGSQHDYADQPVLAREPPPARARLSLLLASRPGNRSARVAAGQPRERQHL
jgi:hypothetical protein